MKTANRLLLDLRFSLPMSVPGLIYLIQNKLIYIGLQNLESATYSMLCQLKLLTTAGFSVLILGKKFHGYQWKALILLFIGVILIQAGPAKSSSSSDSLQQHGDVWMGTVAVIGVATLSGLAGVYFEYVLKGSSSFNIWDRNVQLSVYGMLFGFLSIPFSNTEMRFFQEKEVFYGWSKWTVLLLFTASFGGLLVSAVVAYTDNISKNFATSLAILLTSLVSYSVFGDLDPNLNFICGTVAVLLAVSNYNEDVKTVAKSLGMLESNSGTGTNSDFLLSQLKVVDAANGASGVKFHSSVLINSSESPDDDDNGKDHK